MKNQISHNGHVHQIVDGIDLYEMSNGNITHQLDEADDHFRFSVTGTDYNTGLRRPFRFLLNAGLRRVSRGSLDLVYTLNLIDETVKEALARENHFITGNMPRGAQFERAFTRQILTPNTMAYR